MSYMHIDNLYKNQIILLFREVYALEKIHGTSAHIAWNGSSVCLFSGGEKHDRFAALFTLSTLADLFHELGHDKVVIFGESYGGNCQGMSSTYGKDLRFVAFEVQVGDTWLDVPNAENVVQKLNLEFVHYTKVASVIETLDAERDADSVQAIRNGMGPGKMREGIVIRPLIEVVQSNGQRIIAKHKRVEFAETRTKREVTPEKAQILTDAEAIALEWVTDMRLRHVVDKLTAIGMLMEMKNIPQVIQVMVEDIEREGHGEIVTSNEARRAIGTRTAKLYKVQINTLRRD